MHIHKLWRLSVGVVLLAGLAAQPVSAEPLKTRLAQNLSPISGIAIVAKALGFFDKQGLDVEVSNFTSGKQALDTVIGGAADIATTAEAPVTAAAMSGQPIAFVAGMEYSDIKTLTSATSGIKTRADLRGKKIAYTAGHRQRSLYGATSQIGGPHGKDVTLINLRPQDMLPALASGSIDAFDTWEPHVANGKKALGEKAAELEYQGSLFRDFQHCRDAKLSAIASRGGRKISCFSDSSRRLDESKPKRSG